MRARATGLVTASMLALAFGACADDSSSSFGGPAYSGGADCSAYVSCATCTPVQGCGWCYDSDGTGMCTPDPGYCATPSFSWTWNVAGCRVPADAGITSTPRDASGPAPPDDTGTEAATSNANSTGDGAAGDAASDSAVSAAGD